MAKEQNGKKHESYQFKQLKAAIIAMVVVVVISAAAFVAMFGYFHALEQAKIQQSDAPPPMLANQEPYDGPLLQANVTAELSQVRAEAEKALSKYGWVDKDAGVVHMPIAAAMELALKRGYPVRKDVMTP